MAKLGYELHLLLVRHKEGTGLRGIAVSISSRLQLIKVNDRVMGVRKKHSLHEVAEKERYCGKLNFLLNRCPSRNTLIALGDSSATSGTDNAGYELCVGPHGSGIKSDISSRLLSLAILGRFKIAAS